MDGPLEATAQSARTHRATNRSQPLLATNSHSISSFLTS